MLIGDNELTVRIVNEFHGEAEALPIVTTNPPFDHGGILGKFV